MSENGLDLFGGRSLEEIPEDNNLPEGKYPESIIESAKVIKSKNGPHGIAVNFKDTSEDGFGLTAFKWIGIPASPDKAQYLLRDLKALTLTGEQLIAIAGNVKGTDPETAEVNIEGINEVLADVVGVTGETVVSTYTNKRTGEPGTNVYFNAYDDEYIPVADVHSSEAKAEEKPAETVDTNAWFNN